MIYANSHKLIDDSDWKNTNAGTNLLTGSQSWKNFSFFGNATKTEQKYRNGTIVKISSPTMNNSAQMLNLPHTTLLSWSIYAKADSSNVKLHTELNGGGGKADIPLTQDWKRYSFNGYSDNLGALLLWKASGDGSIYLALPKIELGSIATQWSLAPQELATQSDITSLQDQINQLKSKLGGVKPSYRLYYAISLKEVA